MYCIRPSSALADHLVLARINKMVALAAIVNSWGRLLQEGLADPLLVPERAMQRVVLAKMQRRCMEDDRETLGQMGPCKPSRIFPKWKLALEGVVAVLLVIMAAKQQAHPEVLAGEKMVQWADPLIPNNPRPPQSLRQTTPAQVVVEVLAAAITILMVSGKTRQHRGVREAPDLLPSGCT